MDLISAFKSELFRPLSTIIVPGTIAIGPWLLSALALNPYIYTLMKMHSGASAFLFIILTTASGFILENFGARIERSWDHLIEKNDSKHHDKWNEYLKLTVKDEIIGQRYIKTIVTRMKFELAFAPALVIGLIGMIYFNCITSEWLWFTFSLFSFLVLLLSAYLIWESFSSAKIAAETRDLIITAVQFKSNISK